MTIAPANDVSLSLPLQQSHANGGSIVAAAIAATGGLFTVPLALNPGLTQFTVSSSTPADVAALVGTPNQTLSLGPTALPDSNRFAATIERLVFLGEVREVHLRGPGDWPVVALTLQSQSQNLREGQSLTISVPPELVVVLLGKYAVPRA